MAAQQPTNMNYLSPLGFRFLLDRTPTTEYFIQSTSIPSITLGEYTQDNPFVNIPVPGSKLRFEPVDFTFRVDEDMKNYMEIYEWLTGLGFPESFQQYSNFVTGARNSRPTGVVGKESSEDQYSDGSLIIMTSAQNPNVRINFKSMIPISLSALTFDTTFSDVDYLSAQVTFAYTFYDIEKI
jgi:hypothetical protein